MYIRSPSWDQIFRGIRSAMTPAWAFYLETSMPYGWCGFCSVRLCKVDCFRDYVFQGLYNYYFDTQLCSYHLVFLSCCCCVVAVIFFRILFLLQRVLIKVMYVWDPVFSQGVWGSVVSNEGVSCFRVFKVLFQACGTHATYISTLKKHNYLLCNSQDLPGQLLLGTQLII